MEKIAVFLAMALVVGSGVAVYSGDALFQAGNVGAEYGVLHPETWDEFDMRIGYGVPDYSVSPEKYSLSDTVSMTTYTWDGGYVEDVSRDVQEFGESSVRTCTYILRSTTATTAEIWIDGGYATGPSSFCLLASLNSGTQGTHYVDITPGAIIGSVELDTDSDDDGLYDVTFTVTYATCLTAPVVGSGSLRVSNITLDILAYIPV